MFVWDEPYCGAHMKLTSTTQVDLVKASLIAVPKTPQAPQAPKD